MTSVTERTLDVLRIPLCAKNGTGVTTTDVPLLSVRGLYRDPACIQDIMQTFYEKRVVLPSAGVGMDVPADVTPKKDNIVLRRPLQSSDSDSRSAFESSSSSDECSESEHAAEEEEEEEDEEDEEAAILRELESSDDEVAAENDESSGEEEEEEADELNASKKKKRHRRHQGVVIKVPKQGFLMSYDCFSVLHQHETLCFDLKVLLQGIGVSRVKPPQVGRNPKNRFRPERFKACTRVAQQFGLPGARVYVSTRSRAQSARKNGYVRKTHHYTHYLPVYMLPLFLAIQDRPKRIFNPFVDICRDLLRGMRDYLAVHVGDEIMADAIAQFDANLSRVSSEMDSERERGGQSRELTKVLYEQTSRMESVLEKTAALGDAEAKADKLIEIYTKLHEELATNSSESNKDTAVSAFVLASKNEIRLTAIEKVVIPKRIATLERTIAKQDKRLAALEAALATLQSQNKPATKKRKRPAPTGPAKKRKRAKTTHEES